MPSTREQKAKARKSRELDMLSHYVIMDVMLEVGNSNSIERELDNQVNVPEGQQDVQSFPNEKIHLRRTKLETSAIEMSQLRKED